MRDDIHGGLKNALDRGATMEQAVRSFINAGYHEAEVREAARALDTGVVSLTTTTPVIRTPTAAPLTPTLPRQQPPPVIQRPAAAEMVAIPRQRPSLLIIALSVVLLLSVSAFVASLLFKESIALFLSKFF